MLIDPYSSPPRTYTFASVRSTAITFGTGLLSAWDWKPNDVLLLFTPNCIDTPSVMFGTHWAGGIVSPANPGYTASELAFQLKDSGARAIVTQLPFLETAVKAAEEVGIPRDRIVLMGEARDPEGRFKHFSAVRNLAGTSRYRRVKRNASKDLAFLPYSSGTTGRPKGVMLSHTNVAANTLQNVASESKNMTWQKDSLLAVLPFFHIYGMSLCYRVCGSLSGSVGLTWRWRRSDCAHSSGVL